MKRWTAAFLAASVGTLGFASGCSSSGTTTIWPLSTSTSSSTSESTSTSEGTSNGTSDGSEALLAPPPSGEGIQLQMVSELAPGVETERCRFFQVPAEGWHLTRQEVRFTPGSHHVLLFTTPYAQVPTQDRFGTVLDTSGVFECGARGPTAHWDVNGVAGGSQTRAGATIVQGLPEHTAIEIPGGSVLLMNTHYINASTLALQTEARINLYLVPAAEVKVEAGIVFFYNPFIRVGAKEVGTAREVCPVLADVELINAQSHMHKRGVNYRADLLDADGSIVQPLYEGTEWGEVVMQQNTPPVRLEQGQQIDFHCDYLNPEARVVTQGLSTADEMCMFVGLYYPRHRQFELCGLNDSWSGAFLAARWLGSGTANGAETLACLASASAPSEDRGDSFYGCVVDSCAAISEPVSSAARCLMTRGLGACEAACQAGADACRACWEPVCGPALTELGGAGCEP